MGTNIYLKSDFVEEYDKYLHDPMSTNVFERLTKSGPSRFEMFKMLEEKGYRVPPHGKAKDLINKYLYFHNLECKRNWEKEVNCPAQWREHSLIVYEDMYSHKGEGKIKRDIEEIGNDTWDIEDNFAILYLYTLGYPLAVSYRELYIGNKSFSLIYSSATPFEWRSNVDSRVRLFKIKDRMSSPERKFDYPIYALDFIFTPRFVREDEKNAQFLMGPVPLQKFYIDLNIAPGLPQDCGFEELISPEEVAKEIQQHLEK